MIIPCLQIPDRFSGIRIYVFSHGTECLCASSPHKYCAPSLSHTVQATHPLSSSLSLSLAGARALSPPAFSAAECVCYWWCQEILLNCFESQQLQSQAHILTLKNPHMRQRLNIWIGFSIFFLITHAKMWKYYGNIEYLFQLFGVLAFPIICYYVCAVCLKV